MTLSSVIKVHCRYLNGCQRSSGSASNRSSKHLSAMCRGLLSLILSSAHLGSRQCRWLISPAWQSSALIIVALGSVPFPVFQHLTGCNLIFPFRMHDGSKPVQVKFVFDPTAGLLPGFTTMGKKNPQTSALLIIPFCGTAMVGEMLTQLVTVPVLID